MADIVISVATKVAEYLVEPTIRQGQYLFRVHKVIKDLENKKEELISERDSLQDRVEQAKKRTEVIEKPVEKWMNDVKNLLEEVADLEQNMRTNNNCFQGWCPTWRRYNLCKEMVKKVEAMGKLKGKSNIQPFSHLAPLMGIQYKSSENFTYFESTKVAYNQLLEALQDDCIYMIGLYGMGGSGKTTLVTEVGKKVEELNLFNKVLLITVSQTPNIRNIQGKMADMLTLKLEEESEEGRAQRLWLSLKAERRILIIVDDLWGEFNLEDIGIRLDNNNKGRWKVLVTTRCQEICNLMDCQNKIQLGLLSEEEAWTLFQKHARIDEACSSNSLNDVPRELCKECKGLPIAIVAVGSSLKGKSKAEWEVALHSLRHSEAIDDHVEGVQAALSCLKLSYDYLKNKEAELLFLMCSIFPEDYEIIIEDLIRYAVGLGLCRRFSLDSARSRIRAGINKLVDSCLLMHSRQSKDHVKMHDMVRDVALWIALRSEDHKILVNLDKPLSTLAEDDSIRDNFAVSSWYEENQISLQMDAPNLEILLLNTENRDSLDLSHASFEGIEGLKVFAVINKISIARSLSLPQSTKLLTNLRTLRLNGWHLGDISFIANLTRLEVLDLRHCSFNELPNEMGRLKRLKLLDITNCQIRDNYNEAIGKCSQLEELYAWRCNRDYLSQSVVDIVTLPKLQRFVIETASVRIRSNSYAESTRVLELLDFNILNLGSSKKNLLQIAEIVYLRRLHGGCKNIIPDMIGIVGDMNDLSSLCFHSCAEIECIIDTTSDQVGSLQFDALIPRLVELQLLDLKNLKELCRGPPLQVLHFFEKLEKLYIQQCQQLHNIFPLECNLCNLKILKIGNYGFWDHTNCTAAKVLFSMTVAQSLQQLEELTIEGCKELKHIIASGGKHGSNTSEQIVPAPRTSHLVMPNLKKLHVNFCTKLKFIFPISCVQGVAQLQEIQISGAPELKYVYGECDHEDHLSHQDENQIMLPQLEVLKLSSLERLIGIFPENYCARWPSMRELRLVDCPKLTTSWIAMMVGSEQKQQTLNGKVVLIDDQQRQFPTKLQLLELKGLPELNLISWVGPTSGQILSLQCLQHLEVSGCKNLKSLFSMVVHRSLPELISLAIHDCEELEQIIAENEELEHLSNDEVFFPKLTDITVRNCNKLKSLFSVAMVRMLPQLSILNLSKAAQLEEVFRYSNVDSASNEMEIVLSNLKEIQLNDLPSFVDICWGFKLQAWNLQLHIYECPEISKTLRNEVNPFEPNRDWIDDWRRGIRTNLL